MLIAAKRKFDATYWADRTKYERFLCSCAYSAATIKEPEFLGVVDWEELDTSAGPMRLIEISKELNNPSYQPLVRCIVNREIMFLWDDAVWLEAELSTFPQSSLTGTKRYVVYRIGELKEDEDDGDA